MPAQEEFDIIIDTCKNPVDLNENFTDYNSYAESFQKKLNNNNIAYNMTDIDNFVINIPNKSVIYDRKKENVLVGMILFDGKDKYSIKTGFISKEDMKNEIEKFFDISLL